MININKLKKDYYKRKNNISVWIPEDNVDCQIRDEAFVNSIRITRKQLKSLYLILKEIFE